MDRLLLKFKTALKYIPEPEISGRCKNKLGLMYFGSTSSAIQELLDGLNKKGIKLDTLRIRAFPFHHSVSEFLEKHELTYVIEQNRDAQLKSLLKIECNTNSDKMQSILSYNGVLPSAKKIEFEILNSMQSLESSGEVPA